MSPIAFYIGSFPVRWYGIAYLITFIASLFLVKHFIKFQNPKVFIKRDVDTLLNYIIAGVILGGRVGEYVFYKQEIFTWEILHITQGGMSFHGGVCGVVVAIIIYGKIYKKGIYQISDLVTMCVPIGSFLGRLANYVNCEVVGVKTTFFSTYMPSLLSYFPSLNRHPVVFYEAFFEGFLLFVILCNRKKASRTGVITWQFLFFYGLFRFCLEFFRVSDGSVGILSIAQWLSLFMMIAGALIYYLVARKSSGSNIKTKT